MSHPLGILSQQNKNKPVGVVALRGDGRHTLSSVTSICTHCVCLIIISNVRLAASDIAMSYYYGLHPISPKVRKLEGS